MKVAILAGGKGIRLYGEGADQPKVLFQIGSRPIIWHIMKLYGSAAFNDFVILLGHKGDRIIDYFLHQAPYLDADVRVTQTSKGMPVDVGVLNYTSEPWRVTLCRTGLDSSTGERVRQARQYLEGEETFMLTYGDSLGDIDIMELLAFHRSHGKIGTLTVVRARSQFGHVSAEDDGLVGGFEEKPQLPDWVNGGFFVFQNAIFDYLEPGDVLEQDCLPRLAAAGELMAYRHEGFWACMDTYKDTLMLNELWDSGQAPWWTWNDSSGEAEGRLQ